MDITRPKGRVISFRQIPRVVEWSQPYTSIVSAFIPHPITKDRNSIYLYLRNLARIYTLNLRAACHHEEYATLRQGSICVTRETFNCIALFLYDVTVAVTIEFLVTLEFIEFNGNK